MVYAFYPPYSESGNSRVASEISKGLVSRGHDVTVYTTNVLSEEKLFRPKKSTYNIHGVKVHYCRNLLYKPHFPIPLFFSKDLVKEIKENLASYDIIHLHEYRFYISVVLHHYSKRYEVPCILQAHGSLPRIMAKQRLKWTYDVLFGHRLLRDASKVIALSRVEAEQFRSMGVPEKKIEIIPNGIDLSKYVVLPPKGSFKKKSNINEDKKIVLYLGRIHRIKGIDILVRAFSNVIEKLDDVKLVVVGPDDGYLGELGSLTKALKMENDVLIMGPLYGKDKLEVYVDADVYVLSSKYETFPMTVLEAIACGTPVILTENCGAAEYFRDKVGLVVKPDPNHLSEAILELLLNQEKRDMFREKCKTVAEKFDISKIVSKLEEVYEEAVASSWQHV